MDIKLNFINQSNDTNNSDVVIFQKNVASVQETAIAWTVIQNCGRGDNHPFAYPMAQSVAYCDSYGNFTPQLPAQAGQQFSAVLTSSGDSIQMSGAAASRSEIELRNALSQGAITALLYKNGRAIAEVTGVAPGQDAAFELKPTIRIGVASQVEQGEVLNSAILADINTEISLLGIRSADIIMTGGGSGQEATPFLFTLENVVMA